MSDLNKFEPTEAWFARLRSFLLSETSPAIIHPPEDENSLEEEEDSNPDFSRSFLDILEERKKQQQKDNSTDDNNMQEDNKENNNWKTLKQIPQPHTPKSVLKHKFYSSENRMSSASYLSGNDSTIVREQSWRCATDESFEFLEHMYDKTLYGDMTNTTLKNIDMNTSSADTENVRRKTVGNITKILGVVDQTQLNDIEAPSTMWNNSVLQDDKSLISQSQKIQYQTSPVKMVGLLRPSTILEESCGDFSDDNSVSSGSISFKTVPTMKISDVTSLSTEHFQSANDETETKWEILGNNSANDTENEDSIEMVANNASKLSINSDKSTSSSSSFSSYSFKKRTFYDDNNIKIGRLSPAENRQTIEVQSFDSLNSNKTTDSVKSESTSSILDDSLNFNRSSSSRQLSSDSLLSSDTKFTNSELTSNDVKMDLIDFDKSISDTIKSEPKCKKSFDTIEISDDENENCSKDDLNQGFSIQEEGDSDVGDNDTSNVSDKENSLDHTLNNTPREFNDTIEEMEYILQKGMKYMSETGTTPKLLKSAISSSTSLSLKKPEQQFYTPSPNANCNKSPITPRTVIAKSSSTKNHPESATESWSANKDQNQIHFKMPTTTTSRIPQSKHLNNPAKKQLGFQHVISPIGAYIKNTPVTPIIASSKPKTNIKDTKVVKNLEYEARFNSPSKMKVATGPISAKCASGLPKKAYISSEYKHYVDERTPIKIPGGDKIHKYLDSAKLPTVIKHDGRIKLNDIYPDENKNRRTDIINRTVDSSIADLSVMSGEISLLTIKDAQKLGHYK